LTRKRNSFNEKIDDFLIAILSTIKHEKFLLIINHQEYFRMEFIEWNQFIMDGLGIFVLLKEIFEKLKDWIQILTRKRNSFNEKIDDFLIAILSTIKHEKFLLIINHQEYFRMEFIEWDQFIMDGLGIFVLLKEIFEKLKDWIQILTRKRNSFNEEYDDFLIVRFLTTKDKACNLPIDKNR